MSKPAVCYRCGKLIGSAKICPYCFANQSKSASHIFAFRQQINQLTSRFWRHDFSSRVITITTAMFALELLTTLVLYPRAFLPAIFVGPPTPILVTLGSSSPLIFQGSWWAPLTAVFLHGGVIHLGFNMMALSFIGSTIERLTTPWFFVLIYLVSGALGFLLSAFFGHHSIGASGAIFGLIGCGLMIGYMNGAGRHDPLFMVLLNWAIIGLLFGALVPGIDNMAHIGGLIGGAGCGWLWSHYYSPLFRRLTMWISFLLFITTAIGWIVSLTLQLPLLLS